jgi:hypothetical protein
MNQLSIQNLDEGDELGQAETPECCDAPMDELPNGFQCGRCESRVDVDEELTVTSVRFAA